MALRRLYGLPLWFAGDAELGDREAYVPPNGLDPGARGVPVVVVVDEVEYRQHKGAA